MQHEPLTGVILIFLSRPRRGQGAREERYDEQWASRKGKGICVCVMCCVLCAVQRPRQEWGCVDGMQYFWQGGRVLCCIVLWCVGRKGIEVCSVINNWLWLWWCLGRKDYGRGTEVMSLTVSDNSLNDPWGLERTNWCQASRPPSCYVLLTQIKTIAVPRSST